MSSKNNFKKSPFYTTIYNQFKKYGEKWENYFKRIICFGPKYVGPNILVNEIHSSSVTLWNGLDSSSNNEDLSDFKSSIITGYQLGTASGFFEIIFRSSCRRTNVRCLFSVGDIYEGPEDSRVGIEW